MSCITFSVILETVEGSEICLKFLGSDLVPFLYRGLSFTTLQCFGKWESLMDKLQIWVIGMMNILGPSFKIHQISYQFRQLCLCRSFFEDSRYIWFELFEKLMPDLIPNFSVAVLSSCTKSFARFEKNFLNMSDIVNRSNVNPFLP